MLEHLCGQCKIELYARRCQQGEQRRAALCVSVALELAGLIALHLLMVQSTKPWISEGGTKEVGGNDNTYDSSATAPLQR